MSKKTRALLRPALISQIIRMAFTEAVVKVSLFVLAIVALSAVNTFAQSPSVTVGTISCAPGQVKTIPITFTPGSVGVTMLQFDLKLPSSVVLSSLTAGSAVVAPKQAQSNYVNGLLRVVIFGTDILAIGSGTIANLQVGVLPGASSASLPLAITGIVASDVSANNIKTTGNAGYVNVTSTADSALPAISGAKVYNITSTGATVSWTTSKTSNSSVQYGTTKTYGYTTALSGYVTSHIVALAGLQPGTLYHFCARSSDILGNTALSSDYTFTTLGKELASASMTIPRLAVGKATENTYVGVALINLDSASAELNFASNDINGNQSVSSDGAGNIIQPTQQTVKMFSNSLSGSAVDGWIQADSTSHKITGFYAIFNENGTLLDGTTLEPLTSTSFLLTEVESGAYTKLNLINNNLNPIDVTIELVGSGGQVVKSVAKNINANGALVADLFRDLFPGITPDYGMYLRVTAPEIMQGFELLRKGTGDFAALPAQGYNSGSTKLYSPQYVMGSIYRSTLSIINLDPTPGMVQLKFFDKNGVLMGTRSVNIVSNGKIFINDPNFFKNLDLTVVTEGYVEILSDGIRLAGSVVFGDPSGQKYSTALPLVSELRQDLLFGQVASNATYFTGYAVVNPNASASANLLFELRDANGNVVEWKNMVVLPHSRQTWLLKEIFPSTSFMANVTGYVRVMSDRPIAAFSTYGTTNMSAICVVPAQDIPKD